MSTVEKNDVAVRTLSESEFVVLPLAERKAYLKTLSPKNRMDLILADPDARRLVASMEPQEFYWLFKEIGEADAVALLPFASTGQCVFMLDMESWEGWNLSQEKAYQWLTWFMEGGDSRIHELLKRLDFEFLLLFLGRELTVGGGIGDLSNDEERLADYDHTFDDVFMLTFRNPAHSRLIGSFVSKILELDKPLYTALMEGIKGVVDLELEEQCMALRSGRLQDLGFPPFEEALSIYVRVNPATFEVDGGKELLPAGEGGSLVPVRPPNDSLLLRALNRADSPVLVQELNYLVNNALVAEVGGLPELEVAGGVLQRVYGYLNIALEHLCSDDEQKGAEVLTGEPLKRLFQLGYSIVLNLKFAAERSETTNYVSGKALSGLKAKRPRFYRGFDPDGVDGYREFRDMADVQRAAQFLRDLNG